MDAEQYILLILADGNLPTGSFVASSGLESYVKHGFFSTATSSTAQENTEKTIDFIRHSLESYAHTAIPFVTDAHAIVSRNVMQKPVHPNIEAYIKKLLELDALYDSMTLNHVTRRASKAQGVALLTLFSKGFSRPTFLDLESGSKTNSSYITEFVNNLKLQIRRGEIHGHLPICWGVLTAALGLSVARSRYLHLFLHARGLLSAAIRMNVLGPYASQQLLLHVIKPIVDSQIMRCTETSTGIALEVGEDDEIISQRSMKIPIDGPANTWPLGEILAARHDLQHSRIFNS